MARYIITQTQLHNLIYKILDEDFVETRREQNPYLDSAYSLKFFNKKNKNLLTYYWYGPGEDDEGIEHNGIGSLHIHEELSGFFRKVLSVRVSKIMDIIADWVSEKYDIDIDEVEIISKDELL